MSRYRRPSGAGEPLNRPKPVGGWSAWLLCLVLAVGGLSTAPGDAAAQDMDLLVSTQWSLLDRILAFDRSFEDRASDGIVVGVLYQSLYRPSINARNQVEDEAGALDGIVLGSNSRLVSFDLADVEDVMDLGARLEAEGVDFLYVTPLRGQDLPGLASLAGTLAIPTFTGVREYLNAGLGVGMAMRGGRPEILVNLEACRAQGMDLDAQFLRLATVLGHDDQDPFPPEPGL